MASTSRNWPRPLSSGLGLGLQVLASFKVTVTNWNCVSFWCVVVQNCFCGLTFITLRVDIIQLRSCAVLLGLFINACVCVPLVSTRCGNTQATFYFVDTSVTSVTNQRNVMIFDILLPERIWHRIFTSLFIDFYEKSFFFIFPGSAVTILSWVGQFYWHLMSNFLRHQYVTTSKVIWQTVTLLVWVYLGPPFWGKGRS